MIIYEKALGFSGVVGVFRGLMKTNEKIGLAALQQEHYYFYLLNYYKIIHAK